MQRYQDPKWTRSVSLRLMKSGGTSRHHASDQMILNVDEGKPW
jgi:hypothetical protein